MNFKGFYFITDSTLTKNGVLDDVEEAIKGGAAVVQYREKHKDTKQMIDEALRIKSICARKAIFIINDRVDIALAVGADGVHLGETDMPYEMARRLLGTKIIGVTVHNLREALAAEEMGADYLGLSPIFDTRTKTDAGPAAGLEFIREVNKRVKIPTVAIGGITIENAKSVMDAGATTFCAISATMGKSSIKEAVEDFNKIIISGSASKKRISDS